MNQLTQQQIIDMYFAKIDRADELFKRAKTYQRTLVHPIALASNPISQKIAQVQLAVLAQCHPIAEYFHYVLTELC